MRSLHALTPLVVLSAITLLASPARPRVAELVLPMTGSDAVVDGAGNLYVLSGNTGRKVAPGGAVSVFIDATGDGAGNPLDCSSLACRLTGDAAGNLYVNDDFPTPTVFRITPAGMVTKIIDQTGDGLGNVLDEAWAIPGLAGDVYVNGRDSNNVFHVDATGVITEIIDETGDGLGNPLTTPPAFGPSVAADGTVYVSGAVSNNVFKIEPGGTITEIVDASGDGLGNPLSAPHAPHVDAAGNVFVVGDDSRNAFKITPGGTVTEIIDETGDGAGHAVVDPQHNFLDALGNFWVASLDSAADEVSLFRIAPGGAIVRVLDERGDGDAHPVFRIADARPDAVGNVYVAVSRDVSDPESQAAVLKITPGGGIVPLLDRSGDGMGNEVTEMAAIGVASDGNMVAALASAAFRVSLGCSPTPQIGCRQPTVAGKSVLRVNNVLSDNRDAVKATWVRGQATSLGDFGDPAVSDDYEVCLYDGSATPVTVLFETSAPAGGVCVDRPCWRELGAKGFRYGGRGVAPSGLRKLVLKPGPDGAAKIIASGRGLELKPMALPLALPVILQVQAANGQCWEATFSAGGVTRNDETAFKGFAD